MSDDDLTREEYYAGINLIADVIEEAMEDGATDIHELIWQEIDSHEWVIYYSNNLDVLQVSTSEPGEWKHYVDDDAGYKEVLQVLAYATMEADVQDELRDRDLL